MSEPVSSHGYDYNSFVSALTFQTIIRDSFVELLCDRLAVVENQDTGAEGFEVAEVGVYFSR